MNLKKKKGVCSYDIHTSDFFKGGGRMERKRIGKKGEMEELGMIILVAITLIVGVIFFQAISQEVGKTTTISGLTNSTQTLAAADASIYLTDYRALSDVVITNATGAYQLINSANYTVTNNVVYNGNLAVQIETTTDSEYGEVSVNISAVAQKVTYIPNSGARAVAGLIGIFFALAVLVVALSPTLRSGVLDMMKK